MRKFICILLLSFFSLTRAQTAFFNGMTKDIRADYSLLVNLLLSDEEVPPQKLIDTIHSLYDHLSPHTGMPEEDILKISRELWDLPEYHDLLAMCKLTEGVVYLQQRDTVKAEDALEAVFFITNSTNHWDKTLFQDFLVAMAEFIRQIPHHMKETINSYSSIESRVTIIRDVLRLRSLLRRISTKTITVSTNEDMNWMLLLNILDAFPDEHLSPFVDEADPKGVTPQFLKSICNLMIKFTDDFINIWVDRKYPAQHVIDEIERGTGGRKYAGIRYVNEDDISIEELALHGFGPATFILGSKCEEKKPKDAFAFYKLSSEQGCVAGTIRAAYCQAYGIGCKENPKAAFQVLKSYCNHADFPEYGASAYVYLLAKNIGDKADVFDILYYASLAARNASKDEREFATQLIDTIYDEYYE